jgi:hypothetical protein
LIHEDLEYLQYLEDPEALQGLSDQSDQKNQNVQEGPLNLQNQWDQEYRFLLEFQ